MFTFRRGSMGSAVQAASRPRAGMIPPVASYQLTPARAARRTLFPACQADIGRSGGEMSRQLPPRPNLRHLKKQAKELLEQLQDQQLIVLQRVSDTTGGLST